MADTGCTNQITVAVEAFLIGERAYFIQYLYTVTVRLKVSPR